METRVLGNKVISRAAERRRLYDTLYIVGTGNMAFGVWSVLKSVFLCITQPKLMLGDNALVAIIALALIAVYLAFDTTMRFYVGIRARRQAREQSLYGGKGYIVCAIILAISHLLMTCGTVSLFFIGEIDVLEMVLSCVIELTCFLTLVIMLLAIYHINELSKQLDCHE